MREHHRVDHRPASLPAQALDHGAGYLLAAGVCRALVRRARDQRATTVRASLLGVAHHLWSLGARGETAAGPVAWPDDVYEQAQTAWGPARRVRCPGRVHGAAPPAWELEPGPLGDGAPAWAGAP